MKTKELYAPEDRELFESALVAPYQQLIKMKISLDNDLKKYAEAWNKIRRRYI